MSNKKDYYTICFYYKNGEEVDDFFAWIGENDLWNDYVVLEDNGFNMELERGQVILELSWKKNIPLNIDDIPHLVWWKPQL